MSSVQLAVRAQSPSYLLAAVFLVGGLLAAEVRPAAGQSPPDPLSSAPAPEIADHAPGESKEAQSSWLDQVCDNFSMQAAFDGSKEPEDMGINAHFGYRFALNGGIPILPEFGLGLQVGSAFNKEANGVRVLRAVDNTRSRWQDFTTIGLFQRTGFGVNYGMVYDYRYERYYKNLDFGQWRGQIGYEVTQNDELGIWGAFRDHGDGATVADQSFTLRPIDQVNFFWRHVWENEAVTRMWGGVADKHGRFLLVAPGESPVNHPFVFGGDFYMPLSERFSIFAEANFITPNDTGTIVAMFGFVFYPGGGAKRASRGRFAPMFPLANHSSFAVDLEQ